MVKIAVMGFGIVGSGVVEVLAENSAGITRRTGTEIAVKYILDIIDGKDSPFANMIIKDFSIIENDPEVKIVVETIGGVGAAYDFTKRSLLAGKSVITSNKELVATKGLELMAIAKEKNVNYLFEASVGGGIPIIRPIGQCIAANEIDEIYGILNGTTNYILTEMIECGTSFEDALKQAQAKGYAESNPTADVEGFDACRKISILSNLCFGRNVDPDSLSVKGISDVELLDVECAESLGYKIKLLGRAVRIGEDKITAYVEPHLMSASALLANVNGVMNAIVIKGNAVGELMFYGPGAGKRPTASAVIADVIDAAKHLAARKCYGWDEGFDGYVTDSAELVTHWYLRVSDKSKAVSAFADAEFVECAALVEGEVILITSPLTRKEMENASSAIDVRASYRILD